MPSTLLVLDGKSSQMRQVPLLILFEWNTKAGIVGLNFVDADLEWLF
jgi:hypothetical protein